MIVGCECYACRMERGELRRPYSAPYDYLAEFRPIISASKLADWLKEPVEYHTATLVRVSTPDKRVLWLAESTIRMNMHQHKDAGYNTDNLLQLAYWLVKNGVYELLGEVVSYERDLPNAASFKRVSRVIMGSWDIEFMARRK